MSRRFAAPRRGLQSPPWQELLGVITSHGPPKNLSDHLENQRGRRKRRVRRPRARCCLLKGCGQSFQPRQANQRYCSAECRKAARKWSRWKARQRYRATKSGKAKRTDQSRRYRERIKSRKPRDPEVDNEAARVITPEYFFRAHVRPAGVLRGIPAPAAKPPATRRGCRKQSSGRFAKARLQRR
jgi:hypothetical protein